MLSRADKQGGIFLNKTFFGRKVTFILIITAMMTALFVCPTVQASAGDVTVGEISFKYSDGTDAFSFLKSDVLTVSCNVTCGSGQKSLKLYTALFDGESENARLLRVVQSGRTFSAGESAVLGGTFNVPENTGENYCIKAFVFDDEMKPYAYRCIKKEVDSDTYFAETPSVYRYYAPGIIRPDEGTIQLTVCPDRPSSELGNAYDMIFRIASGHDEGNAKNSVLALCIPVLSEERQNPMLQFVLKNKSGAFYLEKPFTYDSTAVGQKFNIAVSWKAGGNMYMYVASDSAVQYIGGVDCPSGLDEDTLSYFLSVDKEGPMHVSDMMISSKQLYSGQISKPGNFAADRNTTLLATENMGSTAVNKSDWIASEGYNTMVPAFRAEKQIYSEGETVVYPLMSVNHSGESKTFAVDIAVTDADGIAVFSRSAQVNAAPDSKYHIKEIPLREIENTGLYKIHTRITAPGGTYREYDSSISIIPEFSGVADGALSEYYGHHVPYDSDVSVFKKLNVTSSRMWANEFIWYNLEPTEGNWQWKKMDDYVDAMEDAGIDLLGVLGYPSRWAAQEPTAADYTGVNGNALKWEYRPDRWKPKSYEEWENYVYTVVDRYKGRIKYWEVYNEVNFHPPYHTAAFSGSTEEYAELLRIAYAAAKRADPDCEVLISGFSAPSGGVDSDMPNEFTKSKYQTGYFDIFNVHGYSGANAVSSWLTAHRAARPGIKAFMTEEFPYNQAENTDRAYAAVRLPLEFMNAGYDKYYHFGMFGQDGVFTTADTLSPKEAYQAVGVLQANLRKCETCDGSASGFSNSGLFNINSKFTRTDGKKLFVFGATDQEFNVYLRGNVVYCTDIYGKELEPQVQQDGSLMINSKNIMYIVTDGNPVIVRAELAETGAIIRNGGFESLDGDVAAVGLSNCNPLYWAIRKLNSAGTEDNSAGSVRLSTGVKNSGQYGLWIRSNNSTGKVYIYQDIDIPEAGTYKITAKIKKNIDNGGLTPYMFFFDRDSGVSTPTILNIEGSGFTSQSIIVTAAAPTVQKAAFGVGIYSGLGEIYVDDVSVEKISDEVDTGALITNGGFEILDGSMPAAWTFTKLNGTTGEYDDSNVSIAKSSGTKNSGTYSMWFRTNNASGRGYASQDITVPAAGTYRISLKMCRRSDDENLVPYIFVTNRDTGVTENTFISIDSSVNAYTFTDQTAEFTVTGSTNIEVGAGIYSGRGQIYIDDVEIERIGN